MTSPSVVPDGVDTLERVALWRDGPSEVRLDPRAMGEHPGDEPASAGARRSREPMAGWFAPIEPEQRLEVRSPEDAAAILLPAFSGADRERCVSALLDTKHRLLRLALVSVGSIDHTFMAPREIFRDALLANATAIVVAHNHPSGDAEPSRDDAAVTRRLARAGELVGVQVLDHLVVGAGRWVSLARRGVLEPAAA